MAVSTAFNVEHEETLWSVAKQGSHSMLLLALIMYYPNDRTKLFRSQPLVFQEQTVSSSEPFETL